MEKALHNITLAKDKRIALFLIRSSGPTPAEPARNLQVLCAAVQKL